MQQSFDTLKIAQLLGKKVFSAHELAEVAGYTGDPKSISVWVKRLMDKDLVMQVKRGVYCLVGQELSNFEYSNVLYAPSYISLDSALNYYGILTQVPLSVTSVTLKRAKTIVHRDVAYDYFHVNPGYFWGFEVVNNVLVADPEKSLIDKVYFESFNKDAETGFADELIFDNISKEKLVDYAGRIKNKAFSGLMGRIYAKFR